MGEIEGHAPVAFSLGKRPGKYCTGGWVVPGAGQDKCEKSHLPPGFDPRLVQP